MQLHCTARSCEHNVVLAHWCDFALIAVRPTVAGASGIRRRTRSIVIACWLLTIEHHTPSPQRRLLLWIMVLFRKLAVFLATADGVIYRRPSVPGGRIQLRAGDDPSREESADGWVRAAPPPVLPMALAAAGPLLPFLPGRLSAFRVDCPTAATPVEPSGLQIVPFAPGQVAIHQPSVPSTNPRSRRAAKPWKEIGRTKLQSTNLRSEARAWLKKEDKTDNVKPLMNSSFEGAPSVVAKCKRCSKCTKEWAFYLLGADDMVVLEVGSCGGTLCESSVRIANAKKYSHLTHDEAKKALLNAGIDPK